MKMRITIEIDVSDKYNLDNNDEERVWFQETILPHMNEVILKSDDFNDLSGKITKICDITWIF